MTRGRRAALLAGICLALAPSAALAADGAIGVSVVEPPASDDPRSARYVVARLSPGEAATRVIEVTNGTSSPRQLSIYASAAEDVDGRFEYAEGRRPSELTRWTRASPAGVEIDTEGSTRVQVEVRVPSDAAPGERQAVVWAEVTSEQASGVQLVSRVGMRMYITVVPAGSDRPWGAAAAAAVALVVAGGCWGSALFRR